MATISVLNTTSDLSGKTLVTAEGDRTLTGLLSFSRGGGAPFAVNVGAGNVANLDADKVDGVDVSALVANRVPYASGPTVLTNSANLTFDGTTLTVPVLSVTTAGINFPAVQQVSANVNTLDDYEEGSWTPVLGGSGGSAGITYGIQVGWYVKVGKLVTATYNILLASYTSITGTVQIQGLPFTAENFTNGVAAHVVTYFQGMAVNFIHIGGFAPVNGTTVTITGMKAAGVAHTALVTGDFGAASQLVGQITFRAST